MRRASSGLTGLPPFFGIDAHAKLVGLAESLPESAWKSCSAANFGRSVRLDGGEEVRGGCVVEVGIKRLDQS
jgi:hypothetical protein